MNGSLDSRETKLTVSLGTGNQVFIIISRLINDRTTTTQKYRTDLAREFKLIRNEEIYLLVE